jgi:transcriptional regulator with XRE-family HTH domain
MMSLNSVIGESIRDIRKEKHLTLRQVSKKASIALGHLSDVETGKKNASNDLLEAIARGLEVTISDLIGEVYSYLKEQDAKAKS